MDPLLDHWQPTPISLTIEGFGWKGEGYGRHRGQIISVPHTLPGDRVVVRCGPLHRGRAWGEVVAWESRAQAHVDPACRDYARCNGCALRHLSCDDERGWKLSALQEILARYGPPRDEPLTLGWIDARRRSGHRTRGRFRVEVRGDDVHIGLRSTSLAGDVTDVRACPAQSKRFLELLNALGAALDENLCLAATVSAVEIWTCAEQGAARLLLVAQDTFRPRICELLRQLGERFEVEVVFEGDGGAVEVLGGPTFSMVVAGSLTVDVPLRSWCHTNAAASKLLLDWVASRVHRLEHQFVLDLCCALGSVTARLAPTVERIIAVDEDHHACDALKKAARERGYAHIQVRPGRLGRVLRKLRRELHGQPHPTCAVVNPMRKPLGARHLEDLRALGVNHILYLGPSPVSTAKDAAFLASVGFRLVDGAGVNLHPATGQMMLALEFEHLDRA